MSTMPNDNAFLASAGRHQRKSAPQKKPINIQTLLIAVALILIVSSFFLGNNEDKTAIKRIEISTTGQTIADTAVTESITAVNNDIIPPAVLPVDLLDGERARLLINSVWKDGKTQPTEVFQEAEKLRQNDQFIDAWLLYFYTARQGHGPSSAALASMSDPFTRAGYGSPLPDADEFQALKWYSTAQSQGFTGNEDAFLRLKNQIQKKASSGDSRSIQLLLQLENL